MNEIGEIELGKSSKGDEQKEQTLKYFTIFNWKKKLWKFEIKQIILGFQILKYVLTFKEIKGKRKEEEKKQTLECSS